MPYGAMRRSGRMASGGPSPPVILPSTPSDVGVATPSSANAPSPHTAPSPTSVAVDRAHLFVQGKHSELLMSMNRLERR
jgi:hypothetical protein